MLTSPSQKPPATAAICSEGVESSIWAAVTRASSQDTGVRFPSLPFSSGEVSLCLLRPSQANLVRIMFSVFKMWNNK